MLKRKTQNHSEATNEEDGEEEDMDVSANDEDDDDFCYDGFQLDDDDYEDDDAVGYDDIVSVTGSIVKNVNFGKLPRGIKGRLKVPCMVGQEGLDTFP